MKKYIVIILAVISWNFSFSQDGYIYTVDLTNVKEDKVMVTVIVPDIKAKELTFYLPKIIPGTYSIADYGRFVTEFKALDKRGRELSFEKKDENSWVINKAKKLEKITYWVDDSYDYEEEGPEIFQPAGTNIEEGNNYILNNAGFFGYFEGMKNKPFTINVLKPEGFYGGTGLQKTEEAELGIDTEIQFSESDYDTYKVENYDRLIDSPLMYSKPDTALIRVAETDVLITTYSPNNMVTSKEIASTLEEILYAQRDYLKGNLPVDKYAFIFYFTDQPVTSYGALEHSFSSLYYMPEMTIEQMEQQLRDFAAHEFFHIITPLTIHSEEIHRFDFNDPKMSKHLWLYEGVTEYFAGNAQVQGGLVNVPQYMNMIREKLITSQTGYNDSLAFTDLSKYTLDKYSSQYGNVYQKGALIGMCLDILLISKSEGEYNLRDLILDLSEKLGSDNYFQDEELFEMITEMTYPEIGEFFERHVAAGNPIPYEEYFQKVGINYTDKITVEVTSFGFDNSTLKLAEGGRIAIANEEKLDAFGKALGLKNDDIIVKMEGKDFPPLGPEIQPFLMEIRNGLQPGKELSITVERGGEEVVLAAENFKVPKDQLYILQPNPSITEEQQRNQDVWWGR